MKKQQFLAALSGTSPGNWLAGQVSYLGKEVTNRVCAEEDDQYDIGSRVHVHMDSSKSRGPEEVALCQGLRTEEGCNLICVSS